MKSFFLGASLIFLSSLAMALEEGTIARPPARPEPPAPPVLMADDELFDKAVAQGAPAEALKDAQEFLKRNTGREFPQEIYLCKNQSETDVKPCAEKDRTPAAKTVVLREHAYVVIIDYSRPSTEKRVFVINRVTGIVEKMLGTHGKGSGNGSYAYKFSNIKDSRQTSLGFYLVGEEYTGTYGPTLRMYGLEKANDQAYHRDIVMHGAWYADESFLSRTNYRTGKPYGRLGVSWGCPAVALGQQKRLVPLLKEGALIYHYHPELKILAQSGAEVRTRETPLEYIPRPPKKSARFTSVAPKPRPAHLLQEEEPAPAEAGDDQASKESSLPSSSRDLRSE